MKTYPRYLEKAIRQDVIKKMVWIAGPRQVGKTTLMKCIGKKTGDEDYMNWDDSDSRTRIINRSFKDDASILLFDELHKYHDWKNYLKGLYDTQKENYKIIVSGSARLDVYRRGGDSLLGRYYRYRLHPFSLPELLGTKNIKHEPGKKIHTPLKEPARTQEALQTLLHFGGFPEPLLSQDDNLLRRFRNQRIDKLVYDDIRDLESIRSLNKIDFLAHILPEKVGSLLSINSIREDLSIAHNTIAHWMDILESFFVHFRIYPYTSSAIRSLKKEPKLYLWDWSDLRNEGAKIENLVASHLLKFIHFLQDTQGLDVQLYFLRDRSGHEVDFLITHEKKPWFAVEVKSKQNQLDTNMLYFKERLNIPHCYQLTTTQGIAQNERGIHIISADRFLSNLI